MAATGPGRMAVPDAAARIRPGGCIVAITDGGADGRHEIVCSVAAELAAAASADVILFHAPSGPPDGDAGRARRFDPLAGGAPDGQPSERQGRLHTGARRRDLLRGEAARIRALGPRVEVWLSRRPGLGGLAEAVVVTGADLVLIAAEPDSGRHVGLVVRRTLAYHAARIPIPLIAVGPGGVLALVCPLGSRTPETTRPASLPTLQPRGMVAGRAAPAT